MRPAPAHAAGSLEGVPDSQRSWLTLRTPHEPSELVLDAALEPISLLSNDTLADFDFPGPKRLRNYLLVARPSAGPLAGRDALVVVSLLASKRVELRVIARGEITEEPCVDESAPEQGDAGAVASGPKAREYYGFFRLR
jgi:hypothetical protein